MVRNFSISRFTLRFVEVDEDELWKIAERGRKCMGGVV
jgi:hypothetical protein